MTATPPRVRGFACPDCQGVRPLMVVTVDRPARGLVVRYRQCGVCGFRLVTEERERPARPRQPPPKG